MTLDAGIRREENGLTVLTGIGARRHLWAMRNMMAEDDENAAIGGSEIREIREILIVPVRIRILPLHFDALINYNAHVVQQYVSELRYAVLIRR
jgi:hypothetical protein